MKIPPPATRSGTGLDGGIVWGSVTTSPFRSLNFYRSQRRERKLEGVETGMGNDNPEPGCSDSGSFRVALWPVVRAPLRSQFVILNF